MPRVTITVPEKTAQPYRFQLDRQLVTLGRGSDNDIAIDCGSVSVKHAEMRRVEGGYSLRDLGSTNGIKLDGERFDEIPLRNGMSVTLGDVAFDFLLSPEELATLALEKPSAAAPILFEADKSPPKLPPLREEAPRLAPQLDAEESGGGGFGIILILLILAAAAFCVGMAIRFQKETGGSLLDAIKAKRQAISAPAKVAQPPAPEPTAAPVVTPAAPAADPAPAPAAEPAPPAMPEPTPVAPPQQ